VLGDSKTEEVEEADGERDGDIRANKDALVRDSLVPSAGRSKNGERAAIDGKRNGCAVRSSRSSRSCVAL